MDWSAVGLADQTGWLACVCKQIDGCHMAEVNYVGETSTPVTYVSYSNFVFYYPYMLFLFKSYALIYCELCQCMY